MDTHAASFRTGRALCFQRTLGTGVFGKMNDPTRHKGHFLFSWTKDDLLFPIQGKRLLGKALAVPNRPSFAIDLQLVASLTHQMAAQIGPVDMQFFQSHVLSFQICTDGFGHTGFRDIGGGNAYRTDKARVPVVQHMPLVSLHPDTATFASMAHLRGLHTDSPNPWHPP